MCCSRNTQVEAEVSVWSSNKSLQKPCSVLFSNAGGTFLTLLSPLLTTLMTQARRCGKILESTLVMGLLSELVQEVALQIDQPQGFLEFLPLHQADQRRDNGCLWQEALSDDRLPIRKPDGAHPRSTRCMTRGLLIWLRVGMGGSPNLGEPPLCSRRHRHHQQDRCRSYKCSQQ